MSDKKAFPDRAEIDPKLLEFCETDSQRQAVQATIDEGSFRAAAKILGIHNSSIARTVGRVRSRAARRGYAPERDMIHPTPATHVAKGVSTLYDDTGAVRLQWVKSDLAKEHAVESIRNAIEEYAATLTGKSPEIPAPKTVTKDLLASYNIGDAHVGMYAWHEETERDFDADIASAELKKAFGGLVSVAPAADTALILQLGDFFHFDDDNKRTKQAKNALDGDTRVERVFRVGLEAMNHLVGLALQKHRRVIVRNVRGNHDDITSIGLKYAMWAFWSNNKRVTVELSPDTFWYHEFGLNLIMATHGHQCKPANMPAVLAADKPEAWGRTKYRYCWHGHFHSKHTTDHPGARVEGFTNLAPNDAWHHGEGYRSPSEMTLVILHKDRGEIGRYLERA